MMFQMFTIYTGSFLCICVLLYMQVLFYVFVFAIYTGSFLSMFFSMYLCLLYIQA
ncbi:hypothetical protein GIB67_028517, partial [Kingdonia uniflora]